MIQTAKAYITSCSREATELPTMEGLSSKLEVDDDTLVEWAKQNTEFSATIKELKSKQKNQLVNDGLYGGKEVNQAMAIFLLKANHEMIETDRHLVENKDMMINLNIDGDNKFHRSSKVPAETD